MSKHTSCAPPLIKRVKWATGLGLHQRAQRRLECRRHSAGPGAHAAGGEHARRRAPLGSFRAAGERHGGRRLRARADRRRAGGVALPPSWGGPRRVSRPKASGRTDYTSKRNHRRTSTYFRAIRGALDCNRGAAKITDGCVLDTPLADTLEGVLVTRVLPRGATEIHRNFLPEGSQCTTPQCEQAS